MKKLEKVIKKGAIMNASGILSYIQVLERTYFDCYVLKSTGIKPREGYETPIVAEISGGLINAVGLSDPGAKNTRKELKAYKGKKPVIASVTANTVSELIEIISELRSCVDAFELNLSCPNIEPGESCGITIGKSKELTAQYVKTARKKTKKPIIVKLPPLPSGLEKIVKTADEEGASALTLTNTVAPAFAICHENNLSILTRKEGGGLSGPIIKKRVTRAIEKAKRVSDIPIIACGGIESWADIRDYKEKGAYAYQVGTALAHKNINEINEFVHALKNKLPTPRTTEFGRPKSIPGLGYLIFKNTEYKKYTIEKILNEASDIKTFYFNKKFGFVPGQFVMAWLPGISENPFSLAKEDAITAKRVGDFTEELFKKKKGEKIYIRGPFGQGFPTSLFENKKVLLIAGGVGAAPLASLPKKVDADFFAILGAKTKKELVLKKEFERVKKIITTDDGSEGVAGTVLDGLKGIDLNFDYACVCGKEKMEQSAAKYLEKQIPEKNIYISIERYMKCAIGVCGSCECGGLRVCIDGPVLNYKTLKKTSFGKTKRKKSGEIEKISN